MYLPTIRTIVSGLIVADFTMEILSFADYFSLVIILVGGREYELSQILHSQTKGRGINSRQCYSV